MSMSAAEISAFEAREKAERAESMKRIGNNIKKSYARHCKHPTFPFARLCANLDAPGTVTLQYLASQRDLTQLNHRKTLGSATVSAGSGKISQAARSSPGDAADVVGMEYHGRSLAVIRKVAKEEHVLELWEAGSLQTCVQLKEVVSTVYSSMSSSSTFGSLQWSPSGDRLLFVGEPKAEPDPSWFETTKTGDEANRGNKFKFKPDWGEGHVGACCPSVYVVDASAGTVTRLATPDGLSVGQAVWTPKENVVLCGWPAAADEERLGLIYCFNRASGVYLYTFANEKLLQISTKDKAGRSPQFNPSGKQLVWLENPVGGPHSDSGRLMCMPWPRDEVALNPKASPPICLYDDPNFGLHTYRLRRQCWASDRVLLCETVILSCNALFAIDITKPNQCQELYVHAPAGQREVRLTSMEILCARDGLVVLAASAPDLVPTLFVGKLNKDQLIVKNLTPMNRGNATYELLDLESDGIPFCAILLRPPTFGGYCDIDDSYPMIVVPHGGPHSVYVAAFSPYYAAFMDADLCVLLVNYRGSLGQGKASVQSLLGKIGTQDVADCQKAVQKVCTLYPEAINPDRLGVFGGSHGGFLAAHLSAQYPEQYVASALRNPVIDLAAMAAVTDIPDWTWVEAGLDFKGRDDVTLLEEASEKLQACSPIQIVNGAIGPTLMLLGAKDRRVPPSQGRLWYSALKRRGVNTELHVYPEDGHPLNTVECEADVIVQLIRWLLVYV